MSPGLYEIVSARLPEFAEPMKAKLVNPCGPAIGSAKSSFDGYRALALRAGSETQVLSRNKRTWGQIPEVHVYHTFWNMHYLTDRPFPVLPIRRSRFSMASRSSSRIN